MTAGIAIDEGSALKNLRFAANSIRPRTSVKNDGGIWRMSADAVSYVDIVVLFGSLHSGDLVAPFPLILSRDSEAEEVTRTYNNSSLFRSSAEDVYVFVDVKSNKSAFSFQLLSAVGGTEMFAWYHLPKKKVTDVLMKS